MTASSANKMSATRLAAFAVALAALVAAFCVAAPSAVHAQEKERIGLLHKLFGSRSTERAEPARPPKKVVQPKPRRKKATRAPAERQEAAPQQPAAVTKNDDAHVVVVIGDFLASGLAEGLTTAFTNNANVKIVDRSNGSSGLVRSDFYDWPGQIDELISADRPAAIVVMIGANDRQQMTVDGEPEAVRSENWNREYAERAGKLAKGASSRKVPLLWVGMPPFKLQNAMLDMLAFNEVYRAAASSVGGGFIDIWDGFADENGAYVANGPDLNGQPARLRANDGINLARPGKRKVAFYVETPLFKLLGEDPSASAAAAQAARPAFRMFGPFGPSELQEPADIDILVDPNEVGPINPARPVALNTPALDGGTELLGVIFELRREALTPAEKLMIEGLAPTPPAGRADQFIGTQLASAVTAGRQIDIDTSVNKVAPPSTPPEPVLDRAAFRPVLSDALAVQQPSMPPRMPPEIVPDGQEEIAPGRAAPEIASAGPLETTPATLGKGVTPDFAAGNPSDRAPERAAPLQRHTRPTSIGTEPNRVPTPVPLPVPRPVPLAVEEILPSGDIAGEGETETTPALPDTAPARAPVTSELTDPDAEISDTGAGNPGTDRAPARGAPTEASMVPVAALADDKEAPSEIAPEQDAPPSAAPTGPAEQMSGISASKGITTAEVDEDAAEASARPAPTPAPHADQTPAASESPMRSAPSAPIEDAPAETSASAVTPMLAPIPVLAGTGRDAARIQVPNASPGG